MVTRGLIDELDDDELAAVIAHELAHIRNGDIRLMAAANACLRVLGWLIAPRMKATTPLKEVVGLPVVTLWMPPVLVFVLIVNFLAQSALKAGRLVRLLISSSREFVADAVAVEVTQNPAALVSALRKIHGNSTLPGLAAGQHVMMDAMMIDGAVEGSLATHPGIDERLNAIIAVTGSMALIAPARRDTRPVELRGHSAPKRQVFGGFGRRGTQRSMSALHRVVANDDRNWLGLTRNMTYGAITAVLVVIGCNAKRFDEPLVVLQAFDPRPFHVFMAVAAKGLACNVGAIATITHVSGLVRSCDPGEMSAFLAVQSKQAGPLGAILATMAESPDGTFASKSRGRTQALAR